MQKQMKTPMKSPAVYGFVGWLAINLPLMGATFIVTNALDSGAGSLRQAIIDASLFAKRYDTALDRVSAYEMLKERAEKAALVEAERAKEEAAEKVRNTSSGRRSNRQGVMEAMIKSVVRSVGSSLGRQISRGILGSILKG